MANKPGPQPDVKYYPKCKNDLVNVPRDQMTSRGYVRKMGQFHRIPILMCVNRAEINGKLTNKGDL